MSLRDNLSQEDFEIFITPITNIKKAEAYIDMLVKNELLYHFDEGAANIEWNPDYEPDDIDLKILIKREDQIHYMDWATHNKDPMEYALGMVKAKWSKFLDERNIKGSITD